MGRGRKFTSDRKWCNGCGHWHLFADFGDNKHTASGKQDYCKACHAGRSGQRDYGHPAALEEPVFPIAPEVKAKGAGFIYVIGNEELGRYKIGVAKNVQKRLVILRCSSPVPLNLVAQKGFQDVLRSRAKIASQVCRIQPAWGVVSTHTQAS
jgi:hypothetical protein